MQYVNETVLAKPDTASQTSDAIDANQLIAASFHVFFGDATAAGTVKIQASNDICNNGPMASQSGFTPTNWVDIAASGIQVSTATIASGASALLLLPSMCYRWVRIVYTRSGGGSTIITVNMNAQSI